MGDASAPRTAARRPGGIAVCGIVEKPRDRIMPMLNRRRFLAAAGAAVVARTGRSAEEGFTPLFNGQDLTGWEGDDLLWVVENGELVGRSPGISYNDFLATEERYSDFTLRF